MAEITLAGYTGYLFQELVKAREMADAYSRRVAGRYGEDAVLQHFSVPRFKIPKMELTVPVLVSGARFRQTIRFRPDIETFVVGMVAIRRNALREILVLSGDPFLFDPNSRSPAAEEHTLGLYRELSVNPGPAVFSAITELAWTRIFTGCLSDLGITELYAKVDRERRIQRTGSTHAVQFVRENTVVDKTELESLLVDPETNVVRQESDATSVFTLKAELVEESFYLRTVTDEKTGEKRTIVEFE